jgi:hypothetical protein
VAKNREGYPIAPRMNVVEGFRKTEPAARAANSVSPRT